MFGGSSKLGEEGTCSLYLYATKWGGLRVAPSLSCQSPEDPGSSAGLGLSCQGPWPTTSQRIFMSAAKKTGNQVIARRSVKLPRVRAFLPVV
jgi:hypothetical protein